MDQVSLVHVSRLVPGEGHSLLDAVKAQGEGPEYDVCMYQMYCRALAIAGGEAEGLHASGLELLGSNLPAFLLA